MDQPIEMAGGSARPKKVREVKTMDIHEGLLGVYVTRTRLSEVDGEHGRLSIGGVEVGAPPEAPSFETLAERLLCLSKGEGKGEGPGKGEGLGNPSLREPSRTGYEAARARFGAGRVRAFSRLGASLGAARDEPAMDSLRYALAGLPSDADDAEIIGAVGVSAAAWMRRASGLEPIAPDPDRSHAADVLRMMTGHAPSFAEELALDGYLSTVIDHGLNASTFAARVVASTGSDATSAVVAAIGALKGPLHGGAPGPVLDMLDEIGEAKNAEAWLERELLSGRRIMGMGHRIYRSRDPRADVLEGVFSRLAEHGPGGHERSRGDGGARLRLAKAVEGAATVLLAKRHPDRPLRVNVEFYTAVLLEALGVPRAGFSAMFAVGRVGGWCAHIHEQRARGKLIRPDALYDGPNPFG